jgi:hypothetical protein
MPPGRYIEQAVAREGVSVMKAKQGIVIALAAALAGCATAPMSGPVEVMRYHLGEPLERGTLIAEPATGGPPASLEFQTYAAAVETEAYHSGFTAPADGAKSQYLASVGFTRTTEEGPPRQPPLSIGLGGGSYSGGRHGGVGLGGGISFPIGKSHPHFVVLSQLSVQIRRRADDSIIWEGHARTASDSDAPDAAPGIAAAKMAHALFLGFPGESGRTITVK